MGVNPIGTSGHPVIYIYKYHVCNISYDALKQYKNQNIKIFSVAYTIKYVFEYIHITYS